MIKDITLRHELKFLCSDIQLEIIAARLQNIMSYDLNQGSDAYLIRSVYMDTPNDRYLNESIDGIAERNKYRIRFYNNDNSFIRLEKKYRKNYLSQKKSCILSYQTVEHILENELEHEECLGTSLLEEIYMLIKTENLQPKVIVEYDRTAFVSEIGNVRVTFDRNLRVGANVYDFFSSDIMTQSALPVGRNILEVKYDGILPGYIANALNIGNLEQISFSKYALCRQLLEFNGRIGEGYEY